jgi:NodT family efflux transporter outer membrane factor (OMF) lipoprotein
MKRRAAFPLYAALSVLALSACSLAPEYKVPETPNPPAYKESGDWAAARPADEAARGNWWKAFRDERLNALEDKVSEANLNLKIAVAQYDEARAAVTVANADYFPAVTGGSGALRERNSGNAPLSGGVTYVNDFSLGANASYEIDVWGRVRNEVEAASSEAEASAGDLASIDLSLHAEMAADYFALRGDDALQQVLDKTAEIDQKALDLLRDRMRVGTATDTDVAQAETQLETVRTQQADVRLQRAQMEHAIAVLIGQVPADFHQDPSPLGVEAPPKIGTGLPSALLERRPDIAAAERRANAANAEVGVARAAWFPTFSLTGSFGYESASSGSWLKAPSQFWTLGPTALVTLFDAGRISALSDEAHAAYDAAAASYRQTVLSAYQDVEDNLAALHHLSEEEVSEALAAAAAERALTQENNLYLGGNATYIDVAVSQNQALTAELALINIRVRRMTATVNLIKALGGGWEKSRSKETAGHFTQPE